MLKFKVNRNEKHWVATTMHPQNYGLMLLTMKEYKKYLKALKERPTSENKRLFNTMVQNAEKVTLSGYFKPNRKQIKRFKLHDGVIKVRGLDGDYLEFWNNKVFFKKPSLIDPKKWPEDSKIVLTKNDIKKLLHLD